MMNNKISTDIEKAVSILKAGGLVAIPTETVYGLAADALNPEAVKKIFAAKGRPADHPLIVHLNDASQIEDWAIDVPAEAYRLFDAFWPGPLTVICKKAPKINDIVTGGQDTIGLRVPAHPIAQALLTAFGGGLAAPSANKFGRISPTTAEHVFAEVGNEVDLILEGGRAEVGIESTIVDFSTKDTRILRPGMISSHAISRILGYEIPIIGKQISTPRVSGSLASHYAPRTPAELIDILDLPTRIADLSQQGKKLVIISHLAIANTGSQISINLPNNPLDYAYEIYAALREADNLKADRILITKVPEEWQAILDRLNRATY